MFCYTFHLTRKPIKDVFGTSNFSAVITDFVFIFPASFFHSIGLSLRLSKKSYRR